MTRDQAESIVIGILNNELARVAGRGKVEAAWLELPYAQRLCATALEGSGWTVVVASAALSDIRFVLTELRTYEWRWTTVDGQPGRLRAQGQHQQDAFARMSKEDRALAMYADYCVEVGARHAMLVNPEAPEAAVDLPYPRGLPRCDWRVPGQGRCPRAACSVWPHTQPPVHACEVHYDKLDPWARRVRTDLLRVLTARGEQRLAELDQELHAIGAAHRKQGAAVDAEIDAILAMDPAELEAKFTPEDHAALERIKQRLFPDPPRLHETIHNPGHEYPAHVSQIWDAAQWLVLESHFGKVIGVRRDAEGKLRGVSPLGVVPPMPLGLPWYVLRHGSMSGWHAPAPCGATLDADAIEQRVTAERLHLEQCASCRGFLDGLRTTKQVRQALADDFEADLAAEGGDVAGYSSLLDSVIRENLKALPRAKVGKTPFFPELRPPTLESLNLVQVSRAGEVRFLPAGVRSDEPVRSSRSAEYQRDQLLVSYMVELRNAARRDLLNVFRARVRQGVDQLHQQVLGPKHSAPAAALHADILLPDQDPDD